MTLPVAAATALERYEGMLVRIPQTLYGDRALPARPLRPGHDVAGRPARAAHQRRRARGADAAALQAANNLHKIILDDTPQAQNPDPIVFGRGGQPLAASNTLRGGDTVTGLAGVLNYTWGGNAASANAYRLRPVARSAAAAELPAGQPAARAPARRRWRHSGSPG